MGKSAAVYDATGGYKGSVNDSGTINKMFTYAGSVDDDGAVLKMFTYLGTVYNDGRITKMFSDVGQVDYDGTVYNIIGKGVGRVETGQVSLTFMAGAALIVLLDR